MVPEFMMYIFELLTPKYLGSLIVLRLKNLAPKSGVLFQSFLEKTKSGDVIKQPMTKIPMSTNKNCIEESQICYEIQFVFINQKASSFYLKLCQTYWLKQIFLNKKVHHILNI